MKKMNDDDILSDTLYVCGLPDVDQDEIDETFSAFGSVESIKFLDPDKKTAFVKFVSSHEAEDAHKYSKGLLINDTLVKVTWGRRSHLLPQPVKQHNSTSTSISTSSSVSYKSSSSSSSSSYSRHSHHDYHHSQDNYHSSSSSSSHSHSNSHHHHHSSHSKDRDYSTHRNEHTKESKEKENPKPSVSLLPPPPAPSSSSQQAEEQKQQQNELLLNPLSQNLPLRPDQEDQFSQFIEKLDGSMNSIKDFSSWIVSNTASEFDVNSVVTEIVSGIQKTNHSKKLFMLFVLTDVFCQKILTRKNPLELDPFSAAILKHIPTLFSDITKSATQEEKDKISAILALWKKREIYFSSFIDTLQEFITNTSKVSSSSQSEERDPTPGEFATMHMFSEAKYGQAPIYYTPFNLSVFKNADMSSVECSDEEIAVLYDHFKKRLKTELEVMDKPLEERMLTGFVEEEEEGEDDDFNLADGYSSLDSDDFSDSDYELETKKVKL